MSLLLLQSSWRLEILAISLNLSLSVMRFLVSRFTDILYASYYIFYLSLELWGPLPPCSRIRWLSVLFCCIFCLFAFLSFCIFAFMPLCLFVFLYFCIFAFLSFCLLPFCLIVFLSFFLSVVISFSLSAFLPFCLFVFLSFWSRNQIQIYKNM